MTPAELAHLADQATPGPWEVLLGGVYASEMQADTETIEGAALRWPLPNGSNTDAHLIAVAADPAVVKAWLALREAAEAYSQTADTYLSLRKLKAIRDALAALDAALATK